MNKIPHVGADKLDSLDSSYDTFENSCQSVYFTKENIGMRIIPSKLVTLVRAIRKINRLDIDKGFKNKIMKSYLAMFFLKRVYRKNKIANIAGYKINFLDYGFFNHLFHEVFMNQEYFFTTENKKPLIVDCGSNIGMSIAYFKLLYPSSRIISFEPNDDAFLCLEQNIKENNIQSVEINMKAVSETKGTID